MQEKASYKLQVSVAQQCMEVVGKEGDVVKTYSISTSRFGLGSKEGSQCTPLGRFRISEKIGGDQPAGRVFKGRKPVLEITPESALASKEDDLILSRILRLDGLEAHNANTLERYIYIHGTNHEDKMGQVSSHGCIRMKNADIIELFEWLPEGTELIISEH